MIAASVMNCKRQPLHAEGLPFVVWTCLPSVPAAVRSGRVIGLAVIIYYAQKVRKKHAMNTEANIKWVYRIPRHCFAAFLLALLAKNKIFIYGVPRPFFVPMGVNKKQLKKSFMFFHDITPSGVSKSKPCLYNASKS